MTSAAAMSAAIDAVCSVLTHDGAAVVPVAAVVVVVVAAAVVVVVADVVAVLTADTTPKGVGLG